MAKPVEIKVRVELEVEGRTLTIPIVLTAESLTPLTRNQIGAVLQVCLKEAGNTMLPSVVALLEGKEPPAW